MSEVRNQRSEKPILFKGEMVRAILEGHKTQTRRVIPIQPKTENSQCRTLICTTNREHMKYRGWNYFSEIQDLQEIKGTATEYFKPKYQVGDLLWVRESAKVSGWLPTSKEIELEYKADGNVWAGILPERLVWKPKYGKSVPY